MCSSRLSVLFFTIFFIITLAIKLPPLFPSSFLLKSYGESLIPHEASFGTWFACPQPSGRRPNDRCWYSDGRLLQLHGRDGTMVAHPLLLVSEL